MIRALALASLLACSHPRPPLTNLRLPAPDAPLCRVETRVETREVPRLVRERVPCVRDKPPERPALTGYADVDATRREEYTRALERWSVYVMITCSLGHA